MKDLVYFGKDDQPITNSLLVAEKFEKDHRNVLRDVEVILGGIPKSEQTPMFDKTTYIHPQNGQEYPMYLMNRDGFTLLAMGYTGRKAMKFKLEYINSFNNMQHLLSSDDYIIARSQKILNQRLIEAHDKIKHLERLNEEQAPKVTFADAVLGSTSSCLIGELAKVITQNGYEIGQNRLFDYLRNNGYIGRHGERYNIPNQQYVEQGLFEIKKSVHSQNGVLITSCTTKVTEKGQMYFVNKFTRA